jgi:general secretion pathway protein C
VVSPFERVVDRDLIDRAFKNPSKFARSVRVRPYKRQGEIVGFRLRRVKRNSPLYLLGARKGDIVHSVNGVDLTSVNDALAAYQRLREQSSLVFDITRKGRPEELKIHVQ